VSTAELGPCPHCGKREGDLVNAGAGRFPYFVTCKACQFMTGQVRLPGVAVKLWNEAKPAPKRPTRTGHKK